MNKCRVILLVTISSLEYTLTDSVDYARIFVFTRDNCISSWNELVSDNFYYVN